MWCYQTARSMTLSPDFAEDLRAPQTGRQVSRAFFPPRYVSVPRTAAPSAAVGNGEALGNQYHCGHTNTNLDRGVADNHRRDGVAQEQCLRHVSSLRRGRFGTTARSREVTRSAAGG